MTSVIAGAGRKDRVPLRRGDTPPFPMQEVNVKELSIFVDESGDFGDYLNYCPYYIVLLVFHDQSIDISSNIKRLDEKFRHTKLPDGPVHAGPLIRNEGIYKRLTLQERRFLFNALYYFTKNTNISYIPIIVEKKQLDSKFDLHRRINKYLSNFLKDNLDVFLACERIVVYYDNGQMDLTKILASAFDTIIGDVEFKKAVPVKYKLSQAADMLCMLELLSIKSDRKALSNSELLFFKSAKELNKSYLRGVQNKLYK